MGDKLTHFVIVLLLLCLMACTTGEPRVFTVNGTTKVHTEKKVLGIPYSTEVEEFKTPEQAKADLAVKAMEDQQETEAKRATIAMWLGSLLLLAAVACAVIGYLTKGWKRWGGLAALCAIGCGLCWGFVEWIPYLKWITLALIVAAVGMFLYDKRDFDWAERGEK